MRTTLQDARQPVVHCQLSGRCLSAALLSCHEVLHCFGEVAGAWVYVELLDTRAIRFDVAADLRFLAFGSGSSGFLASGSRRDSEYIPTTGAEPAAEVAFVGRLV